MSAIETLLRCNNENSFFLPNPRPYTSAELIAVSQRFASRGDLDTAARFLSATGTMTNEEALIYFEQQKQESDDNNNVIEKEMNKTKKKKIMKRLKVQRRSVRIAMRKLGKLNMRTLRNGKILTIME